MTVLDAIDAGDREALEAALAADPSQANVKNSEGVPALRLAAYFGRKEMAEALRAAGATVDMHTAAALGEPVNGDLASYSSDGWTPLHLAAFFGHVALVEDLIRRGADVKARSTNALRTLTQRAIGPDRRAERRHRDGAHPARRRRRPQDRRGRGEDRRRHRA